MNLKGKILIYVFFINFIPGLYAMDNFTQKLFNLASVTPLLNSSENQQNLTNQELNNESESSDIQSFINQEVGQVKINILTYLSTNFSHLYIEKDSFEFRCPYLKCFEVHRPEKNRFITQQDLKHHLYAIHNNPSIFCSCPDCTIKLNSYYHLAQHLRTHTKEKPYICGQCYRSFSLQNNFDRHLDHCKPYSLSKCPYPYCNQWYQKEFNLKKHIEKEHID